MNGTPASLARRHKCVPVDIETILSLKVMVSMEVSEQSPQLEHLQISRVIGHSNNNVAPRPDVHNGVPRYIAVAGKVPISSSIRRAISLEPKMLPIEPMSHYPCCKVSVNIQGLGVLDDSHTRSPAGCDFVISLKVHNYDC